MLANNAPTVSTDTHDHAGRGPSRNDAARAATPIASSASPRTEPAGSIDDRFGSNTCAQTPKCTAIRAATVLKRRSHPRTVDAGRPTTKAALRCPAPAAAIATARPITATVSTRRPNTTSANKTWVFPHDRHRPRRGRSSTTPPSSRTRRRRANDQQASLPPHTGHEIAPATKSASTRSGSFSTMSTDALRHLREDPLVLDQEIARGSLREQDILTLSPLRRHSKYARPNTRPSPLRRQTGAPSSTSLSLNTRSWVCNNNGVTTSGRLGTDPAGKDR